MSVLLYQRFIGNHPPSIEEIQQISLDYVIDDKGCFLYKGSINTDGRARINIRNIQYPVARLIAVLNGKLEIAELKNHLIEICHKCDNKSCINNEHIYRGTASTNALDIWKGRCKNGHDLTKGDVYIGKDGRRRCRRCTIDRSVVNRRKRNAAKKG